MSRSITDFVHGSPPPVALPGSRQTFTVGGLTVVVHTQPPPQGDLCTSLDEPLTWSLSRQRGSDGWELYGRPGVGVGAALRIQFILQPETVHG